ncbi:DUF5819 family protein [Streptomyces fagopyri]|uniref:DUF5819 family protein n=1 Tax=Streptomyces fagopyri TaxID=2662397 RepID=UPI003717B4AD
MDAYDEGSNARHGPDGPGDPLSVGPVAAGAVPDDASTAAAAASPEPVGQGAAGHEPASPEPVGQEAAGHEPAPGRSAAEVPPGGPAHGSAPHDEVPHAGTSHPETPHGGPAQGSAPHDGTPHGRTPAETSHDGTAVAGPLPPSEGPPANPASAPALTGIAALSLRHQIAAAFALAAIAVVACVHLGMVFLHVAPSNTVTKQHGKAIDEWIYPEFEQNWKLFAPNPLQQNIDVQVRARVRTTDGGATETGWYDLSALDGAAIDGNPLPSHTQQNELRRAWDFYVGTHDNDNRPVGLRGDLSESYLRRVVLLRLDREEAGGRGAVVERVQVRSRTTSVRPPEWSDEQVSDKPVLRELPWWAVPEEDLTDTRTTEASAR